MTNCCSFTCQKLCDYVLN